MQKHQLESSLVTHKALSLALFRVSSGIWALTTFYGVLVVLIMWLYGTPEIYDAPRENGGFEDLEEMLPWMVGLVSPPTIVGFVCALRGRRRYYGDNIAHAVILGGLASFLLGAIIYQFQKETRLEYALLFPSIGLAAAVLAGRISRRTGLAVNNAVGVMAFHSYLVLLVLAIPTARALLETSRLDLNIVLVPYLVMTVIAAILVTPWLAVRRAVHREAEEQKQQQAALEEAARVRRAEESLQRRQKKALEARKRKVIDSIEGEISGGKSGV